MLKPLLIAASLLMAGFVALLPHASPGAGLQEEEYPRAAEPRPLSVETIDDDRRRIMVDGGLHSLSLMQNPDGSIGGQEAQPVRIAVTALSLMAFLADGNSENRGAYADQVRGAVAFLCRSALREGERRGCFQADGDTASRMHGHGYATLALCQVYGQYGAGRRFAGTSGSLRTIIADAIHVIVRSQNSAGGWYYYPLDSVEDEGSITVCMIQALRAAHNCGFHVSPAVIDKAVQYIRASQNRDGSVRYSLRNQRPGTFELTAAGCATLAYGGRYFSREIQAAQRFLWQTTEDVFNDSRLAYPFYGYFYALQALWFDYNEERWNTWFPRFVDWYWEQWDQKSRSFTGKQWGRHKEFEYGLAYRTALAALTLQIPSQFLPIFAR